MSQQTFAIKSMPLYRNVNRVYNELAALGLDKGESLSVEDLAPFDEYHYHSTDAVDSAIASLGLNAESRVLDIGSGIGGPSRYIAATTGASVMALELQPDMSAIASELTRRCGLSEQVRHVCANVLEYPLGDERYDAIVSWLAFYHIEEHEVLLSRCFQWLEPEGAMYLEDLYTRGAYTPEEQEDLEIKLYGRYLPSRERYESEVRAAGFAEVHIDDMSNDWAEFTHERIKAFRRDRARHVSVHGEAIVDGLDGFYAAVERLFASGHMGGLRMICRKSG